MIITMTSSVFLDRFIHHEKPIDILEASYILASKKIIRGHTWENSSITMLRPSSKAILCREDNKKKKLPIKNGKNEDYLAVYYNELYDKIGLISAMVEASISKDALVVILATDTEERELRHLKIIRDFILENFSYPTFKYDKKSDLHTLHEQVFNDDEILIICKEWKKIVEKRLKKSLFLEGEKGRRSYYSSLSKKELKKKLKKVGIENVSSDKAELIDYALAYLDND